MMSLFKNSWIFYLKRFFFSGLLLLVFFGSMEFGLFCFWEEPDTSFFHVGPQGEKLLLNNSGINAWLYPRIGSNTMMDDGLEGFTITPELSRKKSSKTFRVFFLGASTTQGFPHHSPLVPYPQMVTSLLENQYPEWEIESVNLGITATNSFIIREQLKEVMGYEPDLLVIYTGHNEFCGYLGSSSHRSMSSFRFVINSHLTLCRFRFYRFIRKQLLESLFPDFFMPINSLIQELPVPARLVPTDAVYQRTLENYKANLEAIAKETHDAGVPLILCTLVSNTQNFSPFRSLMIQDLDESIKEELNSLYRRAQIAAGKDDTKKAVPLFEEILQRDPFFADAHFYLADAYQKNGDKDKAASHYQLASACDGIKLRAPPVFNDFIRETGEHFEVPVADIHKAFDEERPSEGERNPHLLEHVHPGTTGHAIMAKTILSTIVKHKILPKSDILPIVDNLSLGQIRKISGVTQLEDWMAAWATAGLTRKPPFKWIHRTPYPLVPKPLEPLYQEWELIPPTAFHLSYARWQAGINNYEEAKVHSQIAHRLFPEWEAPTELSHALSQKPVSEHTFDLYDDHLLQTVIEFYRFQLKKEPGNLDVFRPLAKLMYRDGQIEEAKELFERILEMDPYAFGAAHNLGVYYHQHDEYKKARFYFEQSISINPRYTPPYINLAKLCESQNLLMTATSLLEQAIKFEPHNADLYYHLGLLHENDNKLKAASVLYWKALQINKNHQEAEARLHKMIPKDTGESNNK